VRGREETKMIFGQGMANIKRIIKDYVQGHRFIGFGFRSKSMFRYTQPQSLYIKDKIA
jgi:hypothetical protein